ncbi:MAG: cytochrome c [Thermoleophilia bacterium]|nr:cytochrome c [Thermoleophilia bacterium]
MIRFVLGALAALLVLAGAGLAVVLTGAYDVAATDPHAPAIRWALDTTMRRSVERQAEGIRSPTRYAEERVRRGSGHYRETCVYCHGAPGKEPAEWSRGMRPEPPHLVEAARRWNSAQLFWIVKHGIKMAGMPAFGPHHGDEEIWDVVALVERLPSLSPEQYQALGQQGSGRGGEGHGRSEGQSHHEGGGGQHRSEGGQPAQGESGGSR